MARLAADAKRKGRRQSELSGAHLERRFHLANLKCLSSFGLGKEESLARLLSKPQRVQHSQQRENCFLQRGPTYMGAALFCGANEPAFVGH